MTNLYRLAVLVSLIVLLTMTAAHAAEPVFNEDGTCTDEAGNPGVWSVTPPCYSADVYDEAFSIENLSVVYGETKVETWNLDPTIQPSDRLLGVGLVREPFTFKDYVAII